MKVEMSKKVKNLVWIVMQGELIAKRSRETTNVSKEVGRKRGRVLSM